MGRPSRRARGGQTRVRRSCSSGVAWTVGDLAVALGVLQACTLTSNDFEPALTERAPLEAADTGPTGPEPDGPEPIATEPARSAPPGALSDACAEGLACPDGFACGAERCVPSACATSEDLPGCVGVWCLGGSCAAAQCSDGVLGPGEADIDCGGPCVGCALGASCSVDADCARGGCVGGLCSEPSCADGIQNGEETGADCGGGCAACGEGDGCQRGSDCQSGVCGACP